MIDIDVVAVDPDPTRRQDLGELRWIACDSLFEQLFHR
jgi:hypothetical protein